MNNYRRAILYVWHMNIRQLIGDDTDEDEGVRPGHKKSTENTGDVYLLQTGGFFININ
jgi:hypothetical protein